MTKPSITDNKAVDKKEDMDIMRGKSIGPGRLHTGGLLFLLSESSRWLTEYKTERNSELEQGKGDRNRYPHGATVLPGRAWDKERGALPGVQCTAGIRQTAAGQMPARGDR